MGVLTGPLEGPEVGSPQGPVDGLPDGAGRHLVGRAPQQLGRTLRMSSEPHLLHPSLPSALSHANRLSVLGRAGKKCPLGTVRAYSHTATLPQGRNAGQGVLS